MFQSGQFVRPEDQAAYAAALQQEAAAAQAADPNNSGYTFRNPVQADGSINPWIAADNFNANARRTPQIDVEKANLEFSRVANNFLKEQMAKALGKSSRKEKKAYKTASKEFDA